MRWFDSFEAALDGPVVHDHVVDRRLPLGADQDVTAVVDGEDVEVDPAVFVGFVGRVADRVANFQRSCGHVNIITQGLGLCNRGTPAYQFGRR